MFTLERKGSVTYDPGEMTEGAGRDFSVLVYPPSVPVIETGAAVKEDGVVTRQNIVVQNAQTLSVYTTLNGDKSGDTI